MSFKTIFIIVVSVLVTIILMNNTDEIDFWIFGDARMPKLAVLGSMFGLGLIIGFLAGRPRKKNQVVEEEEKYPTSNTTAQELSSEDREYIG